MKILIVAEHDGTNVRAASLACFTFAQEIAQAAPGEITWLVLGDRIESVAASAARFAPVLCVDSPQLLRPLADSYAQTIARIVGTHNFELVAAASSTFAKDVLPRAAALLDGAMASDVVGCEVTPTGLQFACPQYAGAVLATIELLSSPKFVTVRSSSFTPASATEGVSYPIYRIESDSIEVASRCRFIELKSQKSSRPDVSEARVVVAGGRAIKNGEDYEALVGGLADVVGGAIAGTRALVDAGIAPSEQKVGQTGKIVAPELYIALGISGAVQHVAGMKGSRTIVAINSDPDAPIFEVADLGLVGDVYEVVPELIAKLKERLESPAVDDV
ncbi:MAG TPA: FAD-binding protein [Lacipirellulaceae bacterium]|jgi:electron transfer flavoprotein alpha subunit|nr:FAD-binding protein [Lacipirellulaceae bacterium]